MLAAKTRSLTVPLLHQRCRALLTSAPSTWSACFPRTCRKGNVRSLKCRNNSSIARSLVVAAASTCKSDERSTFGALEVQRIPCLSDNYAWLIRDQGSAKTAIIDPSESGEPCLPTLLVRGVQNSSSGNVRWAKLSLLVTGPVLRTLKQR